MTDPNSASEIEERARSLMMAALDQEISADEQKELQDLLGVHPHLKQEWHQFQKLQEITQMTQLVEPPDSAFAGYWQSVYNRLERNAAWILISIGALIVGGWGLWNTVHEILADTSTPPWVKVGLFALLFGGLILAISVTREKLTIRKSDPFEEVEK